MIKNNIDTDIPITPSDPNNPAPTRPVIAIVAITGTTARSRFRSPVFADLSAISRRLRR